MTDYWRRPRRTLDEAREELNLMKDVLKRLRTASPHDEEAIYMDASAQGLDVHAIREILKKVRVPLS